VIAVEDGEVHPRIVARLQVHVPVGLEHRNEIEVADVEGGGVRDIPDLEDGVVLCRFHDCISVAKTYSLYVR
jgi:hypothetical protein